jgi:ribosomal protein L7/L12
MITNLLDKIVKVKLDTTTIIGKVCAICGETNDGFYVAVAAEDGQIHTCHSYQLSLHEANNYYVLMYWPYSMKILAIKIVREVMGNGLREAKDLAESANPTKVGENLTYEQASSIKKIIEGNGLEASILSKNPKQES